MFTPSWIFRPCFVKTFSASLATPSSTAPRKLGSASSTVTSAPRRRHTEPISSPITPEPTTPRRFGHRGDAQRAVVGQDALLVERRARQRARVRAGGDDHVPGLHDLVGRALDRDLVAAVDRLRERPAAVEERDLVLLEQVQDAVVVLLHDAVLAGEHARHVDAPGSDERDAVVGELMPGVLEVLARLQQRLRRNAADVGAGAARRRAALVRSSTRRCRRR